MEQDDFFIGYLILEISHFLKLLYITVENLYFFLQKQTVSYIWKTFLSFDLLCCENSAETEVTAQGSKQFWERKLQIKCDRSNFKQVIS